jgi:antitoxin (DNA-binding transcriptional repressor) of toxin-antitoxin stability system
MSKVRIVVALSILIAVIAIWAVPLQGTAHSRLKDNSIQAGSSLPVTFKSSKDRGLLVDIWIGEAGPFVFAIDTGAGVSIVSRRVASVAKLVVHRSRQPLVGGLSTSSISSNEETTINNIAIGAPQTKLTATMKAAVADRLPSGIDGILDPLDVSPNGYAVDLPHRILEIFNSNRVRLRESDIPRDGAVVRWMKGDNSKRPFVKLGDGRLAVIDTGSNFGLAVNDGVIAGNHRTRNRTTRDLGGGTVQSTRVAPTTVSIGSLELRNVPTELLTGVAAGTPLIIGRAALYPFRITFDPVARLIAIEPAEH